MTAELYYDDAYARECEAVIAGVDEEAGGWFVVLDRTCFYPEGGGQPSDRGAIGSAAVTDVRRRGGEIVHRCSACPGAPGERVRCALDWDRRLHFMQQHTGQHIVSAALHTALGLATVSVHLGEEYTTVEVDAPDVDPAGLAAAEAAANEIVCRNIAVDTRWTDGSAAAAEGLRRELKVTERVRLVGIEGYDLVGCGGVHVSRTGEVGLVHALGTEKIRGNTRITWKIGKSAYDDYRRKTEVTDELGSRLSVPLSGIREGFDALVRRAEELARGNAALFERCARTEALALAEAAKRENATVVTRRYDAEEKGFIQLVAQALACEHGISACLVNVDGAALQWCIASQAPDAAAFRAAQPELLAPVQGRGGGKPPVWQGAGGAIGGIEALFERFRGLGW